MATPAAQVLAAVPSLNVEGEPFTYAVEVDRIVGTWDIVKATTLYPTEVEHVDQDYRIVVELDEGKGRFDFTETSTGVHGQAGAGGASGGAEFFRGKQTKKEFHFSFGGVTKDEDGVSAEPLVYSFDTARIKQPLFAFLEQHGYQHKSFFGRLFSR